MTIVVFPLSMRASSAAVFSGWMATMPAQAEQSGGKGHPPAPRLEQVVVTSDRKGSYSADLVEAAGFRGLRQLDTPETVNVIPDALIQSQQAHGLLDALRNLAGVSPAET